MNDVPLGVVYNFQSFSNLYLSTRVLRGMGNASDLPHPLIVQNSGRWLGNDGSWSTFFVRIGTPRQHFHVLPSTRGQTVYVPIDQDCERMNISDCGRSRGAEIFNQRPSPGFQKNRSSTWEEIGTFQLDWGSNFGYLGNGILGYDSVSVGTDDTNAPSTVDHQAFSAYAIPQFWVGQLGLSQYALNVSENERPPSFLTSLKDEGYIPSLSFGYHAGAAYRYTRIIGSLTLGGYDRSRISKRADDTLSIPIVEDLVVGLQHIDVSSQNGPQALLDDGILAIIDSSVPELWLPQEACDRFADELGLTYHEPTDRYALDDATREELKQRAPTFSITIGGSTTGGRTLTIEIPYAAFDLRANYPIFSSSANYFPLRRAANDTQYTIGRVFLQEAYISVDYERDTFNVSKVQFSSPMPERDIMTIEPKSRSGEPLIPTSRPGKGPRLSAGAIAGIVIGSVVVLLLLGLLLWRICLRKRRVKGKTSKPGANTPVIPDDEKKHHPESGVEIEGRPVGELYAPHGESEMLELQGHGHHFENAPVQGPEPVYELPSR